MSEVRLHETKHPNADAQARYEGLIGIETQQAALLDRLLRTCDPDRVSRWLKQNHPKGLAVAARIARRPPLVILAGEVGCGKTALATSIGTPLADQLDRRVVVVETPSDIRGGGLVGQLSLRVTAAFDEARTIIGKNTGILIIDEGDDLGTSRAQMQAHHEDRAGLNVLIKEIDRLARDRLPITVLLITNRLQALDPALIRRANVIRFARPDAGARRALFAYLLRDVEHNDRDVDALVHASETTPPLSYSDIVERACDAALAEALRLGQPFSAASLLTALRDLTPTPLVEEER